MLREALHGPPHRARRFRATGRLIRYEPPLDRCHYTEASKAADETNAAYEQQLKVLPARSPLLQQAKQNAEAAARKEKDARACEDSKHDSDDLAAQWVAAKAAQNTAQIAHRLYWWGVAEIVLVGLALWAAGWAAWETREANKIARETTEAQLRPYLMIRDRGSVRVVVQPDGFVNLRFRIPFINAGQTPAFSPSVSFCLYFFQAGPRKYSSDGMVWAETFFNLGDLAPNGGEFVLERPAIIGVGSIVESVRQNARHREIFDRHAQVHIELRINGFDYAGKALRPYEVFVETEAAFRFNTTTSTDLQLGHPSLILPTAPGYGPDEPFHVRPTREDLREPQT